MINAKDIRKGEFEKLTVNFISVLRGTLPANRRPVVIKAAGDGEETVEFNARITKVSKDGGKPIIYICIYEPDVDDTQGDSATAPLIKGTAHEFLKKGYVSMIDENHNFMPGAGTLVESQILNATDDDRYPGIRKGAWVGAIEPSDMLLPHLDEITGVSLAGTGVYKTAATATAPEAPLVRESTIFNPTARAATISIN